MASPRLNLPSKRQLRQKQQRRLKDLHQQIDQCSLQLEGLRKKAWRLWCLLHPKALDQFKVLSPKQLPHLYWEPEK